MVRIRRDRQLRVWPGKPYPLGAVWDGFGVNFSLFSEHATKVELCLFPSSRSRKETHRIALPRCTEHVWHGYVPDLKPGQVYGYRVYGRYDPERGSRFNPNKILLDPYAKQLARAPVSNRAIFGYEIGDKHGPDHSISRRDSAPYAPLAQVVDDDFDWEGDSPPDIPWHKTVIYETHVKGISQNHPKVPRSIRGSYLALSSPPILEHLISLGVTAVELLPVHQHMDEGHLVDNDLTNYWGYSTLSYFAPDLRFASAPEKNSAVTEFKEMVKGLHAAGIEVILDVVYNHSCEGNHLGPTLSLRGIDNQSYYRLQTTNPRFYADYTGCGNTLNTQHPRTLQLIMDSLRYWVQEMHVDGFRFDLASALAREAHEVDRLGGFFDIIHQDPVISRVKLIAEPWDIGDGGYQVGNFPVLWKEWNDKYRATLRSFWKGDAHTLGDLATRISGSSDLYQSGGRGPDASINFITCHDGFTLNDLVSYNQKHNKANGENNRDGENHNLSWNSGVEGPTRNEKILALRLRQRKNMMASLLLSVGVPMILGGDELGKTQKGNNNAYCQDNKLNWFNWRLSEEGGEFLEFVRQVLRVRSQEPVFQRSSFFRGSKSPSTGLKDISWFHSNGEELQDEDWHDSHLRTIGVLLSGDGTDSTDQEGNLICGDSFLLLLNADSKNFHFFLPFELSGSHWELVFDTFLVPSVRHKKFSPLKKSYHLHSHSFVLLRLLN